MIGITQSGETADTLAAMRLARESGAKVLAITNIMGSQATRDADAVLYTRAGLEISVAATKTFVAQVAAMYLLGLRLAELRGHAAARAHRRAGRRAEGASLEDRGDARPRARSGVARGRRRRSTEQQLLPLSRPPHRPARLPRGGAEAEGDLLHPDRRLRRRRDEARADRPARRVDPGRLRRHRQPGARQGPLQRRRGARPRRRRRSRSPPRATSRVAEVADQTIEVPRTDWILQPILAILPLQLLAYDIARARGLNVDQPRNLAKTVTVE